MATPFAISSSAASALDVFQTGLAKQSKLSPLQAKAKASAQDFEAVFVNNMFQQMFTDTAGEGPLGSKGGAGVWRSFLTDEYAKTFVKAGGIGISDQVYRSLLAQQGASS
ncbi:MAG: flagellar assembly peptidoglycan hydrolase FlgJ [Pseudolabrys sp.]|nr:flagellar assembly peptidoglycan hydrolase FlgJ [Pseudolabrys sp.]